MADLLIKGINELTAPHDIHISNGGLNGEKCNFSSWDSSVGCAYEVVELPPHGNLIDEQAYRASVKEFLCKDCHESCYACKVVDVLGLLDYAPTVIPKTED